MKFRNVILALLAISLLSSLFAQDKTVNGSGTYGSETLDALTANGLIKLHGTSVTNILKINGSLISQNADLGSIDVMGEANLTGTTIRNGGTVIGSLQAVRSKFLEPITILCQKALFTSSQLQGITIQKDSAYKGKQIIELKQGTLINGPIHFESGKGEVLVFPGCQVLGPVTGGKIIKKS